MKSVTVKAGAWIEKQLWRDGKISSIVVSKISIHGGGRKRWEETGVNHVPVSLRPVALEVAFDDLSLDRNVIEHRDGALWSDYKYREEKAKEENKNKWTGRKRRSDEIEKGYTLMAPDAVPMIISRKLGSHARAVGLFGNPCCTVCKEQEKIFISLSYYDY